MRCAHGGASFFVGERGCFNDRAGQCVICWSPRRRCGLQQGKPQISIDPAALQGLITGSAAGQGLNIERLDNQGDGGLQVSLQPTDFSRLLRWLISLEEQGVRVEEAGLERAEKGLVSTHLLLRNS